VPVDPLTLAALAVPQERQNLTARCHVAVAGRGAVEPADANAARDGVGAQAPDAGGIVAVDGVAHRVGCFESIVAGRGLTARWCSLR